MATVYGKNYTKGYKDPTNNSAKMEKGSYNGHVKTLYDEYTFPANAFAANDIIKVGKLPAGARVIGASVKSPSLGTTGIFDLGNAVSADASVAADQDAFVAQADAGGQAVLAVGAGAGILKKYEVEVDVELKCTEVTTAASGLIIQCEVHYVVD